MENHSVSKGTAILSAAGIIVKVLSIIYIPILLAIIGDKGYSLYGVSYNIYAFVYIITNSGIPVALSKLVSELRAVGNYKDSIKAFKISRSYLLVFGLIFAVILALMANPLSYFFSHPEINLALIALSPTLIFTCVTSAYRGYFQGSTNMTPTAVSQILEQVVRIIISLPFAYIFLKYSQNLGTAVAAATLGTSVSALSTVLVLVWFYRKNKFTRHQEYLSQQQNPNVNRLSYNGIIKKILEYGIPVTICVGMQNAGNLIDIANTMARLIAGGLEDKTASILQSYLFKSQQLINVPAAIIVSLSIAVLPAISAAVARNEHGEVLKKINFAFRMCFIVSLPAMMGFAVLSKGIYIAFKYGTGYELLMYGSITVVLMSVVQIQSSVLQGLSKLYAVTIFITAGIVAKIVINYILIALPSINIYGAIIGSVIGFLIPIYLSNQLIKKTLKVRFSIVSHTAKPLFSSVIMGVVVLGFYNLLDVILKINTTSGSNYIKNAITLIFCIIAGGVVYFVAMAMVGGITKEDVQTFPSRISRFIPMSFIRLMR